ncbi:protein kinase [Streptomyces sp. NPDC093600]|uniref:serine/threonine-protein kinase n=1 Tax=Streptomyces sp. NPDC093600 TaxID=3366047 RepID=UPI003808D1D9
MQPLEAGEPRTIGGYRILGRLGSGGMGRVYLARNEGGRTVAVKIVHPHFALDEQFRARFRREVEAARRVGGRWTAPVLDADPEAAVPWVATGYVAGPTLDRAVARIGPLPETAVRALGAGLAEALAGVHALGLVHRDVKPSNVLLTLDGPRLIDFGSARAIEGTASLTATGASIGSPGYMAPEQVLGRDATAAADVFSLGAVLAYAATGTPPFRGDTSAALLYKVVHEEPELGDVGELRELVTACLSKDPASRPTPAAVATRLAPTGAASLMTTGWLPAPLVEEVSRTAIRLLELDADGPSKDGDRAGAAGPAADGVGSGAAGPSAGGGLSGAGPGAAAPSPEAVGSGAAGPSADGYLSGPVAPPSDAVDARADDPYASGPVPFTAPSVAPVAGFGPPVEPTPGLWPAAAAPGPGLPSASPSPRDLSATGPAALAATGPGPRDAAAPAVPGGPPGTLPAPRDAAAPAVPGGAEASGPGSHGLPPAPLPGAGAGPMAEAATATAPRHPAPPAGRKLSFSLAAGRRVGCTAAITVTAALVGVTLGAAYLFDLMPGGRTDANADKTGKTPSASPPAATAPAGSVPPAFLGTWTGPTTERNGSPHGDFTAVIGKGRTGEDVVRTSHVISVLGTTVKCHGIGRLTSATARELRIADRTDPERPGTAGLCTGGTSSFTLTLTADGTLAYRSHEEAAGRPTGTLRKS